MRAYKGIKAGKGYGTVYDMSKDCDIDTPNTKPKQDGTTVVRVFVVQHFINVQWFDVEVGTGAKDPIKSGGQMALKVAQRQHKEGDPNWGREKATDNHPQVDSDKLIEVGHVGRSGSCCEERA